MLNSRRCCRKMTEKISPGENATPAFQPAGHLIQPGRQKRGDQGKTDPRRDRDPDLIGNHQPRDQAEPEDRVNQPEEQAERRARHGVAQPGPKRRCDVVKGGDADIQLDRRRDRGLVCLRLHVEAPSKATGLRSEHPGKSVGKSYARSSSDSSTPVRSRSCRTVTPLPQPYFSGT